MKVLKKMLAVAALGMCAAGSANAEIISDYYNPFDVRITTGNSYSYTHDMRDQGMPGPTVNWATLTVDFYDLFDPLSIFRETVTLTINNTTTYTEQNVSFLGRDYTFNVAAALAASGYVDVIISVGCTPTIFGCAGQDVWFDDSLLEASITRVTPNEVPEPATLLTLGAGLFGVAATRRRKQRKDAPGGAVLG